MKAFKNWLFLTFVFAISLASSCKQKPTPQPCDSNPCANLVGFDCVEGVCKCPQGKFKVGDYCVPLESYQYYGTGCPQFDTVILSIGAYNPDREEVPLKCRTSSVRPHFPKNGGEYGEYDAFRYRDNNKNLDSISFILDHGGSDAFFYRDTILCFATGKGRFLENDKLRVKFYYRAVNQNRRAVDSCEMILHK
jgi:hypothetical protein